MISQQECQAFKLYSRVDYGLSRHQESFSESQKYIVQNERMNVMMRNGLPSNLE